MSAIYLKDDTKHGCGMYAGVRRVVYLVKTDDFWSLDNSFHASFCIPGKVINNSGYALTCGAYFTYLCVR